MTFKKFSTAIAALSLIVTPTAASAERIGTPLTQQPAAESVDGDSALRGRRGGISFIVLALAVIVIGLGIYIAVDEDTSPNSP